MQSTFNQSHATFSQAICSSQLELLQELCQATMKIHSMQGWATSGSGVAGRLHKMAMSRTRVKCYPMTIRVISRTQKVTYYSLSQSALLTRQESQVQTHQICYTYSTEQWSKQYSGQSAWLVPQEVSQIEFMLFHGWQRTKMSTSSLATGSVQTAR